ncbi:Ig domain-containing protein group 1 domain-containing protein [Alishewanella agri BL06]|uniref:Ig domain-containing protein group 1 domain-containing protein n=1 Tax=Alishewanella agri BL06 TaxID=1195246 RepID=I9P5V2_9ALTE|nr:Ig-like domain-containing protein [Alishewanella agri]EIW90219.1 Ig domain-containing protein group 1 domain-containing protein [Alishewanella agri BL06]
MLSIRQLWVVIVIFVLSACGGGGTLESGGGSGGGGSGTTPVYTLQVELLNATGAANSSLSASQPLTVRATLTATQNAAIAGKVIAFTIDREGLASLSSNTGTALTDSNGVATLTLNVGTVSGAGLLTATYSEGETVRASRAVGFQSAGDGGGETGVTISSVRVLADRTQLGSGASEAIQLSALVRDANNVLLADIPVVFSADSGELEIVSSTTEQDGVAKAKLTSQIDKSIRDIRVSARVGGVEDVIMVRVVGTILEVVAPSAVVLGDQVTFNFSLQDSAGQGIANQQLQVTSALGNALSQTNPTTGNNGQVSIQYNAAMSGDDTVTVTALGLSQTFAISVKADSFVFLPADDLQVPEIELNQPESLRLEWLTDGIPNANSPVLFSTTRGQIAETEAGLSTAQVVAQTTTGTDGQAEVFIRSAFAGLSTISARGGDNEVNTQRLVEFIAVNPSKVEVQAFPAQVIPGESSAIRAIVRDANNNPVKNQLVAFSLENSAGGSISSGTAITNSQGVATTSFTADLNTGAGVEQRNLVVNASLVNNSSIADTTDISVGGRTLFFRFGTGNTVESPSPSLYRKEFSIIVTDASGNPVTNQPLNLAVVSLGYRKGYWEKSPPPPETFKVWAAVTTASCVTEDVNFNGIMDSGEDFNGDNQLTPGNLATVPRTVTSNNEGIAVFNVTYPRDVAPWLDVRLQVSGFAAGTENISYREYALPVAAADVTQENIAPPDNPFGVVANCATPD